MNNLLQRLLSQKYLTIFIAMFISTHAYAGCDSGEGVCKVITDQEEIMVSCQVKVCASANDYMIKWHLADGTQIVEQAGSDDVMTVTINGEIGGGFESNSDEWSCNSLPGVRDLYCMKQPSF